VLRQFETQTSDGVEPGRLLLGQDGVLYGAAYEGGYPSQGTIFRVNPDGSAFRLLRRFSHTNEGEWAWGLADGKDGYLYGTTLQGGALGGGTLYKISTDGSELTVLRNFREPEPNYSVLPDLIVAKDGVLYGVMRRGETATAGSVFKMNRDGSAFTNLHQFGTSPNGSWPNRLIEGSDGLLYGSTAGGGKNSAGVIYSMGKDGSNFALLHHFEASQFPAFISASTNGALFGADGGMVFRVNTDGTGFTVLHSFPGLSGSNNRPIDLILGNDGSLYGTTVYGGDFDAGVLFRMRTDRTDFVILHHFEKNGENSAGFNVPVPNRIVQGFERTIYGITARGGEFINGSIYRVLMPPDDRRPRLGRRAVGSSLVE